MKNELPIMPIRAKYAEQAKNVKGGTINTDEDIVGGTILQTKANYSADLIQFPNATNPCTSTLIFGRVQQLNQELHIILMGKIHNPTENDINLYGISGINIELPASIASKIYDVTGSKVSDTVNYENRIVVVPASFFRNGNIGTNMADYQANVLMVVVNNRAANKITVTFAAPSPMTFKAGADTYIEGRVFLDLL